MTTTESPDPADRLRLIRDHVASENRKLRAVDHNGRPLRPDEDDGVRPAAGYINTDPPTAA